MDLFTFLGWTLLVWLAYKVGVYVERKMQAKAQALQTPDAELMDPPRSDRPQQTGEEQVKQQAATAEKGSDRNP